MTEWISIKDSLPQDMECVIAWGDNDIYMLTFKKNSDKRHKNISGYFDDSSGEAYFNEITHWMPLPKPPKG